LFSIQLLCRPQKQKTKPKLRICFRNLCSAAPVTIACRPKLKEINCRIVKDHSSLRAASKSTRSERAKSSNLYAEVNASVQKKLESAKFAGEIAEKFFGGLL